MLVLFVLGLGGGGSSLMGRVRAQGSEFRAGECSRFAHPALDSSFGFREMLRV